MAAYAHKVYVYLFVTKHMGLFIALILFICFYINGVFIDTVYSILHQVSFTRITGNLQLRSRVTDLQQSFRRCISVFVKKKKRRRTKKKKRKTLCCVSLYQTHPSLRSFNKLINKYYYQMVRAEGQFGRSSIFSSIWYVRFSSSHLHRPQRHRHKIVKRLLLYLNLMLLYMYILVYSLRVANTT